MTAGYSVHDVVALYNGGHIAEAEDICRKALLKASDDAQWMLSLAQLLGVQGRVDEAVRYYEEVIKRAPSSAFPATQRSLLLLRRHWGAPPACRPAGQGRSVSMSSLGSNGRFGNQIFQYAFLRIYAEIHKLNVETPDWIGRDLFGLSDPLISRDRPILKEEGENILESLQGKGEVFAERDFWGYFGYHTSAYAPYQDFFRSLFSFSEPARRVVEPAMSRLRQRGRTVVALHLRRGDFGYGPFWIAPSSWYLSWLDKAWPSLRDPVLFIATDEPEIARDFETFDPVVASDLTELPPGAEFLVDFHVLTKCDLIGLSNSTFSFTASLLNTDAWVFMRPCRERQGLIPYEPWSAQVCL